MASQHADSTPDEDLRRQEELQAQGAAANAAVRHAAEDLQRRRRENFINDLSEADIDTEDFDNLSDVLGPDLSPSHILANVNDDDLKRDFWLNENQAERVLHEHNSGRLCTGPILALAQRVNQRPDAGVRIDYIAEEKRKIREGYRVKTKRQTLGVGARGLKAVSEIISTVRTEKDEGSDEDGGRLKSAYNKVFN